MSALICSHFIGEELYTQTIFLFRKILTKEFFTVDGCDFYHEEACPAYNLELRGFFFNFDL